MILLDTHTLVWWIKGSSKLSSKAKEAILESFTDKSIYISSISIWEICMLVRSGELGFDMDIDEWVRKLELMPEITFVPINNTIARASIFLPKLNHKDPADRIIIATALSLGCPIATKDQKIHSYKMVKSVW